MSKPPLPDIDSVTSSSDDGSRTSTEFSETSFARREREEAEDKKAEEEAKRKV